MRASQRCSIFSSSSFNPFDLGSNFISWFNPDDLIDGLVPSYTSRGSAVTLTSSGTAQPNKSLLAFNSKCSGITFDGVDDNLSTTTLGKYL